MKGACDPADGELRAHCPILHDPHAAASTDCMRQGPSVWCGGSIRQQTMNMHTRTRACKEPGESGQAWLLKAGW
jgi:hypothetical protein